MKRTNPLWITLATLLASLPALAQDPDYTLSVGDGVGNIGEVVPIAITLDSSGDVIAGWSYGVCHDPAVLAIDSADIVLGESLLTINGGAPPEFDTVGVLADGWTSGVIIDFVGVSTLGAGTDMELRVANYAVIAEPGIDGTTIEVCETLGSPPVDIVLSTPAGDAILPTTSGGTIVEPLVILPGSFIRGDVNGDMMVDELDYTLLSSFVFEQTGFVGGPGDLVGCDGAPNLDAGDINDNEVFSVADLLLFRDYLDCGATVPGPSSCGTDTDDDTAGYDAVDFDYVVSAATVDITGAPGDPLDVEILIRLISPTPVKAVQFGLEFGSALTLQDPPLVLEPGVLADFSGVTISGHQVVLTVGAEGCGNVLLPANGTNFQSVGRLKFTLAPFGIFPPTQWLQEIQIGSINYITTVVDDSYLDHQPFLVAGSFQFARGNANNSDAVVDLADAITILSFLFQAGIEPECGDAADSNDDGVVDIADAITILSFLFGSGEPLTPWPECGWDLTWDTLPCVDPICP